jgi:uncharacterized membrane protein YphA (DoxX/SURF4 family)
MKKEHSNRILLGLQFLLAALFLFFGIRKLIGDEVAVQTFSEIGAGQWLRYFVGTLEVAGAIGLVKGQQESPLVAR